MGETWYLLRLRRDGQYFAAYPDLAPGVDRVPALGYLLVFREHADALTYLNQHGAGYADKFAVESVLQNQVPNVLVRWGFKGAGMVSDPLLPTIKFTRVN